MTLAIRYAARSDVGLLRPGNEDAAYAGPHLLAVADGMGGHAAGEVASAVAISSLVPLDDTDRGDDEVLPTLERVLRSANDRLREMVTANQDLEGMGTTVTALAVVGQQLGLVHIGDSRAYLYADGRLTQITRDHTLVQRLVDEGRIAQEDAGIHPQRALITRALDGRDDIEFDTELRAMRPGDRYLLCSDGLSGVISDDTIEAALRVEDPQAAVDGLIDLALRGGAPDNVTAIVADVVDVDDGATTAVPVLAGSAYDGPVDVETRRPARNGTTVGDGDHAAGKAAKATGTAGERADTRSVTGRGRRIRRRRGIVLAILALGILGFGAAVAWSYVQSQYYVGEHDGNVAVFRGVSGSVAGVDLSSRHEAHQLPVAELPEFQQERVRKGIPADSLDKARGIVSSLQGVRADATPAPVATPTATPTPTPNPVGTASPTPT
ncbi:MAG TPA: PP2C family serine/threonine-protein phosphatase [Mycobacteriales bacterium]|nr:PP2C family serine/threonine-protein phosphatase [Mycobacteriales bacterium]